MTTRGPEVEGLAVRLAEIRREIQGREPWVLAAGLGLPRRDWAAYEAGAAPMPAHVLLGFIERTGTHQHWVLTGRGPRYVGDCA